MVNFQTMSDIALYSFYCINLSEQIILSKVDKNLPLIKNLIPRDPIQYSSRHNYTEPLPKSIISDIFNGYPFSPTIGFLSIVKGLSSVPYHTDGRKQIAINIPIQDTSGMHVCITDEIPKNLVIVNEEITDSYRAPSYTYTYPLATNFTPLTEVVNNCDIPMVLNIGKYHKAVNNSSKPAIFVTFRFSPRDEKEVFTYFYR